MSIKSILNLVQQSQRMLDIAGPQLIQESNKKIAETKHKISSESSIKQMMMDEITSNGPELVCNIETKNRIDSVYNKLKSNEAKLQNKLNKSNEKLTNIQGNLTQVSDQITKIEIIFDTLNLSIPTLKNIIYAAKIALIFLKGHLADGWNIIRLHRLIEKTEGKIKSIKDSIKVYKLRVDQLKNTHKATGNILSLANTTVSTLKNQSKSSTRLIESYYLKHTLMCNVNGDSMEDEDYANAVNDAQDNLNNTLGSENEEIIFIEDDLLPGTIERIRNANFQVIRYRIA
jgi:chromosome segregation ATPase